MLANDNRTVEEIIKNFTCHDKGLLLPLINEFTWPIGGRACLYFVGLAWSFLGISIISDKFMSAIEMITSKTRKIRIRSKSLKEPQVKNGQEIISGNKSSSHNTNTTTTAARSSRREDTTDEFIEIPVWNNTVANLTLMALGSSAPEILLSCIEIAGNKFESGQLGPGTIVGSAAFNLLCIIAVCIIVIPNSENRRIESLKVFSITATSSIFAYVWLIIILLANTPGYVDLWEAIVTFICFPVLVIVCYVTDKNCFGACSKCSLPFRKRRSEDDIIEAVSNERLLEINKGENSKDRELKRYLKMIKYDMPNASESEIEMLVREKMEESGMRKPRNYLYYRIAGVRNLTSGNDIIPNSSPKMKNLIRKVLSNDDKKIKEMKSIDMGDGDLLNDEEIQEKTIVEFEAASSSVKEGDGSVKLVIKRKGNLKIPLIAHVETIDGTAKVIDNDYKPLNRILVFNPHEEEKCIEIEIIDDNEYEDDEVFHVKLQKIDEYKLFKALKLPDDQVDTIDLEKFIRQEFQNDYDDLLSDFNVFLARLRDYFDLASMLIGDQKLHSVTIIDDDNPGVLSFLKPYMVVTENTMAKIAVLRRNGCDGEISVNWSTRNGTAKGNSDFKPTDGTLIFSHGESEKHIEINIINDEDKEDEDFELYFVKETASKGVAFETDTICVTIVSDDEYRNIASKVLHNVKRDLLSIQLEQQTWKEQFEVAFSVTENIKEAKFMDYFMHFLTFPFKVLFAFVPPSALFGGWLTFFISLAMIGLLTALVGDLASIAGCLSGLKDSVTSITLVALGTSLPDLFASKQAACGETTADNSIGNVTGSNSVNVFLGLGLPWVMAAVYHGMNNRRFKVDAGSLAFSVVIYSVFSILCIVLLVCRRRMEVFGRAELGGNVKWKWISGGFLVCLWILYILLSAMQSYGYIKSF